MRYTAAAAVVALIGTAAAAPFAAAAGDDNTACQAYPAGNAPTPNPNTLQGFQEDPYYSNVALNAKAPFGYESVVTDSNSTVENDAHYTTYIPIPSDGAFGYNPKVCAKVCSADINCRGFNTYYQRNPSLVPSEKCPNPDAIVHARCALYSETITLDMISNTGQNRGPGEFEVRMRGSNVYNREIWPFGQGASSVTEVATATVTRA